MLKLLDEFADVFVEKPRLCNEGVHEIHVTPDFKPRRLRAYKVPELLKPEVAHKVACVQDMKPPNSKKEVRQILGFFSYFRTYIDRFAEIAKPFTDLTRKQVSSKIS